MFDYLRNLTKSAEEQQQEALNAYLDDALSPQQRQRFEQQMAADADLRQEVEQRQALQMQMRQMPRRRVPRNFTLDPAVYGRPQRQPLFQFYPTMRAAAVLTAFFFILTIGAEVFMTGQGRMTEMSAPAQDIALMVEEPMEEAVVEQAAEAPAAGLVEVTRVVTETVVEEGETAEIAVEEAAAEVIAEEEMAEAADAEESAPVEEAPMLAAEAPEEVQLDDTAEADDGAIGQTAATAVLLPTPSPLSTSDAPVAATKSTVPRPEPETSPNERAVTAVPSPQPDTDTNAVKIEATAVPLPLPPSRTPISGLRLLQIGLGVLLVVLGTAVLYVRRQS